MTAGHRGKSRTKPPKEILVMALDANFRRVPEGREPSTEAQEAPAPGVRRSIRRDVDEDHRCGRRTGRSA